MSLSNGYWFIVFTTSVLSTFSSPTMKLPPPVKMLLPRYQHATSLHRDRHHDRRLYSRCCLTGDAVLKLLQPELHFMSFAFRLPDLCADGKPSSISTWRDDVYEVQIPMPTPDLPLVVCHCHLLPATCYFPFVTSHLLLASCYLPPATCHLLLASCYLPPATCHLLLAT